MKLKEFKDALEKISEDELNKFALIVNKFKKIIILGNGGSSAIASHIAQDYTKTLGKKAQTFSDASRLTCYINDYGMKKAYKQYVSEFADKDTLVILISSSGESKNIINTAFECYYKSIPYIILTGFEEKNELRKSFGKYRYDSDLGKTALMDFWVDSKSYGVVELTHETILHSIC